jgi:hypothetical protein
VTLTGDRGIVQFGTVLGYVPVGLGDGEPRTVEGALPHVAYYEHLFISCS